jgi:hypothetical protein
MSRPRSVTVISWIFIVFGCIALVTGFLPKLPETEARINEFSSQHPLQNALIWAGPILALGGGIFMLYGCNWARWLLVLWFGTNACGNVLHSPLKLAFPGLLFAVVVYFLFRAQATAYFRGVRVEPQHIPKPDTAPLSNDH